MKTRIESIDLLRGLVMVIMALDHARDMFHYAAFGNYDALDLQTTTPILYFTRWTTHFCAPIFIFLSGISIYLQGLRKSRKELSLFLIKRGLWLIFIEFAIITFGWTFNISYDILVFQVIWAIGISMVCMGLLVWMPYYVILSLGIVIVFGHNILDVIEENHGPPFGFWWDLLHIGRFAKYPLFGIPNHNIIIIYPFVPWLGVMMLGYCIGKLYAPTTEAAKREKFLTWCGAGLIILFVLLRTLNIYGDPNGWSKQKDTLFTFLSFINLQKYPPSLLFLCITIGPGLLFLTLFEGVRNWVTKFFIVFGRVPFLYYVLHLYLLHFIKAILFVTIEGHAIKEGMSGIPGFDLRFLIPQQGFHLWAVYLVWFATILMLYPVCLWFSNYKQKHKKWWLSYL